MLSFKISLIEAKSRTELSDKYDDHIMVPHIPYLGHAMPDQADDRIKALSSEQPIHKNSEQHVFMHDLIDKMEREHAWSPQISKFGSPAVVDKANHRYATIARMLNNGATRHDLEYHANRDVVSDDDDDLGSSPTSLRRTVKTVRERLSGYQSDKPENQRFMLGPTHESINGSPFPGRLALTSYLAHPIHREALSKMKGPEFHEKYVRPYTGNVWTEMGSDQQNSFAATLSRAKKKLR